MEAVRKSTAAFFIREEKTFETGRESSLKSRCLHLNRSINTTLGLNESRLAAKLPLLASLCTGRPHLFQEKRLPEVLHDLESRLNDFSDTFDVFYCCKFDEPLEINLILCKWRRD